jgi:alcohol dehydrogenase class IV
VITSFVSPRLLVMGGGSIGQAATVLAQLGLSRPLVVTDPWMVSSGTVEKLLAPLKAGGIAYGISAIPCRTQPIP